MKKILMVLTCFMMLATQLMAQKSVSGRVVDENGNPIANASVQIRGTKLGATTNETGSFTLNVPATAKQVQVSSVGFESISMAIPASGSMVIGLKATSSELEGVVVTGYSRVKKSEYVGAASRIDKKAIELVPVGSFDQILQGRAPGLRVSAGSGQPGASASVQIRGPKSISGGSTPLYIVDGVPVEAGVFQSINPNDFESVDILKDASAAALYGSRGASGVIVVTTRRGKQGATVVSYKPQFGTTAPGVQKFDMMDASEYLAFQEKLGGFVANSLPGWVFSRKNPANASATAATLGRYDVILDSLRNINTDWAKIFQRQGKFQAHDISLSGGSESTRFFISANYYDEQGIGERSDMKRYTLRINLDHKTDKFTLQFSNNFGYSKRNFIESENGVALANPFAASYLASPYHSLFNADGKTVSVGAGRVGPNAYQRIRDIQRYNDQIKAISSITANYDFTENFFAGGNIGFDLRETVNATFVKPGTFTASQSGFPGNTGSFGEGYGRAFQGNGRAYVGFKDAFGKNEEHRVNLTLNAEYIFQKSRSFSYTGYGLNTKLENTPAAITPGTVDNRLIPNVGGGRSQRNYVSQFALLKYSFKDKYILDLSARRDGTSILPSQNRFANFYAAGALWNVLEEGFGAKLFKNFSTLRVRASYGSSANAENFGFGDFGYFSLYGSGQYGGLQTLVPSTPGNPAGDWEYTNKLNLGIEFGLMNDRLTAEVNVYDEITNNLFISQGIPIENGSAFTSAQVNAGKLGNRGVEVNLNYDLVRTAKFNWNIGGNFAYNKNEILSLGQEKEFPAGTAIIRVGLPLGSHYVVKWGGVDAATGAPLYYTKDGKLTNVFSSNDLVADFGTYFAPWTGGFNTSFKFASIDVSAFFNFQAGFKRFNNQTFFQENHSFAPAGYNLLRVMKSMWSKPGDVTDVQSPLFQRQFSSKDIEDASYLRFRNLQVGYTLPREVVTKLKFIKGLRFYAQVQNLFTWTNFGGFDPEDNNNIAQYEYPLPRTFTTGFNLDF